MGGRKPWLGRKALESWEKFGHIEREKDGAICFIPDKYVPKTNLLTWLLWEGPDVFKEKCKNAGYTFEEVCVSGNIDPITFEALLDID